MSKPTREAELATAREKYEQDIDTVSNCCGSNHTEPCASGSARCLDCGEGCVVEPAMTFEDWLEEQQ